ncbi:hypothetical protein [Acidipila sp. EB88]|uniref:hypothetical protein n=1 Tax=Acidipila sp. EB88 TaxID=2305226 RepID=UPI000F5F6CBE|nr:hypothetical protein [Acidipila sp. EB88]
MLGKTRFWQSVVCGTALLFSAANLFAASDPDHPSSSFRVAEPTAIPGRTLAPGTYTIHVVDHLTDRYILRVDNAAGGDPTLFLGVVEKSGGHGSGMQKWGAQVNDATYLRGWSFTSMPTPLEFAYPKNEAVAVAKANNAQVPAIDPESEGIVSKVNLSSSEMQIITLWLLSPTSVGPKSPGGIKAVRYEQLASNAHKPVVARLPHTASMLPWFWLVGTLSLCGAAGTRRMRLAPARRS